MRIQPPCLQVRKNNCSDTPALNTRLIAQLAIAEASARLNFISIAVKTQRFALSQPDKDRVVEQRTCSMTDDCTSKGKRNCTARNLHCLPPIKVPAISRYRDNALSLAEQVHICICTNKREKEKGLLLFTRQRRFAPKLPLSIAFRLL